jgi:hypothetical protein
MRVPRWARRTHPRRNRMNNSTARGEMENRIEEQLSLFADRVSKETLRANQLRL